MEINDRKNEILKSAEECFARYGYEKTTLDDIGKPVGLNKASIYYYYKNKEAIFSDVVKKETGIFLDEVRIKINKMKSFEEKIRFYFRARTGYFEKTLILNKLTTEITVKYRDFFEKLINDFFEKEIGILTDILTDECKKDELKKIDTKRAASAIHKVYESVKYKNSVCNMTNSTTGKCITEKDDDELSFILSLLLNGLKKR